MFNAGKLLMTLNSGSNISEEIRKHLVGKKCTFLFERSHSSPCLLIVYRSLDCCFYI